MSSSVGVQIGSVTRQKVLKNGTFSDADTDSNSASSAFSAASPPLSVRMPLLWPAKPFLPVALNTALSSISR